ncbi:hypothetical protein [Paracoccus siganidrum]|uniref:Uncharacterized protein n=1 Tax=Paracoccus siganidrum TaxID=1276757 RepID=A0A419A9F5_9RHOB|nr:hypothetical protein [Paracoccus siganidrum]RJL18655.1 hypothetical protein D3P05_06800 [Paracoccus siganidrum]RMC36837.1 hypothetical protein C9E82_09805 [Paracoccus siganidrum]
MRAEHAYTGDAEVDDLLFSWGRVIANARGWERGFALSIQRARRRPDWRPSHKQLAVMERLVAATRQDRGVIGHDDDLPDDVTLIEED